MLYDFWTAILLLLLQELWCRLHDNPREELEWPMAEWDKQSPTCHSAKSFAETLCKVFDPRTPDREAALGLLAL